jgi:hypothetical protein
LETKVVLLEGLCRFFNLFNFLNRREHLDTKVFLLEGLCRFFNLFNFLNRRERLDTKVFLLEGLGLGCFNVVFIVGTVTVRVIGKITLFRAVSDSNHRHFLGDPTCSTHHRPKTTRTIRVVAAFLLKLAIN